MISRVMRMLLLIAAALTAAAIAQAGTVHGTVKNGTTRKPAPGIQVILIQLQGGMQPVANSQSDAQGQFSFDHPGLGAQPMLVRAVYHGINFHQPVPPGSSAVEVEIFEASKDPKTISVPTHVVFFQPNGLTLDVGEEYGIENKSQPPQAYFRADGNFDFALPENAKLQQVAASGPAGMPVVQAPIDKTKDRYAIAYAFRPGQNTVRYSYEIPYPGNTATVKIPTVYPGGRLLIVSPPTVQISGEGLRAGGQEQGMSLYARDSVPGNAPYSVIVSGMARPADQAGADGGGQPQGRDAQQGGGEVAGASIQQVPGRLDGLKWVLIGGFVGVFALGAILLARKPVVAVAGGVAVDVDDLSPAQLKKQKVRAAPSAPPTSAAAPAPATATTLADVDAAAGTSLDSLKERIFRLELRHQAGTISEEEYAQERARAEKVLRDLVRG
jgi:hypothetical protein